MPSAPFGTPAEGYRIHCAETPAVTIDTRIAAIAARIAAVYAARHDAECGSFLIASSLATVVVGLVHGQAPAPKFLEPSPLPPLFFREPWRQSRPFDASTGFRPEAGITPAAVTNPQLELRLYDPNAKNVPAYLKNPPPGSGPVDWDGPSCIQLGGYNQNPPPAKVVAGQPSDPPNLWTGVCQTPVAATLRHRESFVNLTGAARDPVGDAHLGISRRAAGGEAGRRHAGWWATTPKARQTANSGLFVESEFAIANVRWLPLDITRVVTRGQTWVAPDLSRVDEVGFADLLPGSGHGWGGFVNVGTDRGVRTVGEEIGQGQRLRAIGQSARVRDVRGPSIVRRAIG